jgi:hypothetical protein
MTDRNRRALSTREGPANHAERFSLYAIKLQVVNGAKVLTASFQGKEILKATVPSLGCSNVFVGRTSWDVPVVFRPFYPTPLESKVCFLSHVFQNPLISWMQVLDSDVKKSTQWCCTPSFVIYMFIISRAMHFGCSCMPAFNVLERTPQVVKGPVKVVTATCPERSIVSGAVRNKVATFEVFFF